MAISINWGLREISVPQSFLSYVGGANYSLDTLAFKIAVRDLEDSEVGVAHAAAISHNTTVTLGGLQYARIVEIINGYTVTFEDVGTPYAVTLIGSNNNILDVTNLNNVAVRSNNSAGLIDVNKEDIEHTSYNNEVTVDVVNGSAGTAHPFGTSRQPVNNMLDAMTIAIDRGFTRFRVVGNITITGTPSLDKFALVGTNRAQSTITFSGADTGDLSIENCKFTGSMNGALYARNCTVGTVTGVGCTTNDTMFDNCLLTGNITLRSDNIKRINFVDTGTATHDLIELDVNGTVGNISFLGHRCRIRLKNITSAISVHVTGVGMELRVAATCTVGTLEAHGDVNVIDEGHAMTYDDDTTQTLVWQRQTEGAYTAEELLRLLVAIAQGNATGLESGSPVFKSIDGTKNRVVGTYVTGTRNITSRDVT